MPEGPAFDLTSTEPITPPQTAYRPRAVRGGSAVAAMRVEPHTSLDDFPTPPWATRALCANVIGIGLGGTAWDPAAGRGHMVRALGEYCRAWGSDVRDYGAGYPTHDFLGMAPPPLSEPDWIITNPPFRLARQFALRALQLSRRGVALFVRLQFLEGIGRLQQLFAPYPPETVALFSERVTLLRGRLQAKTDTGSQTATAYCWIVWRKHSVPTCGGPRLRWIAPCRKALERAEDYA